MTLVGRDSELNAIAAAVARVKGGEFRAVVLTGEPGIGKTSLLAATDELARERGLPVVTARAVTHEQEVPFAFAAAVLEAHAGPDALPEVVGDEPASPGERFRHHRAMSAALDAGAVGRPFGLLLDDVQWADEASFEWLRHLLRRPPRTAALLVLAAR